MRSTSILLLYMVSLCYADQFLRYKYDATGAQNYTKYTAPTAHEVELVFDWENKEQANAVFTIKGTPTELCTMIEIYQIKTTEVPYAPGSSITIDRVRHLVYVTGNEPPPGKLTTGDKVGFHFSNDIVLQYIQEVSSKWEFGVMAYDTRVMAHNDLDRDSFFDNGFMNDKESKEHAVVKYHFIKLENIVGSDRIRIRGNHPMCNLIPANIPDKVKVFVSKPITKYNGDETLYGEDFSTFEKTLPKAVDAMNIGGKKFPIAELKTPVLPCPICRNTFNPIGKMSWYVEKAVDYKSGTFVDEDPYSVEYKVTLVKGADKQPVPDCVEHALPKDENTKFRSLRLEISAPERCRWIKVHFGIQGTAKKPENVLEILPAYGLYIPTHDTHPRVIQAPVYRRNQFRISFPEPKHVGIEYEFDDGMYAAVREYMPLSDAIFGDKNYETYVRLEYDTKCQARLTMDELPILNGAKPIQQCIHIDSCQCVHYSPPK